MLTLILSLISVCEEW